MVRVIVVLLFAFAIAPRCGGQAQPRVMTVCELSNDFGAYRDKMIAVRGIYYYGLRQTCLQTCSIGPWPSSLDLAGIGSREKSPAFVTDDANWNALDNVQKTVEAEAKKGKRLEIWVTAVGRLNTHARRTPLGPCDRIGSRLSGYGHLGAYPAQLVVKYFTDLEIKANPKSPYDYSKMYRGAL